MAERFVVTPWEVKGEVDYNKLVKQFGTIPIGKNLLERIKKHTKDFHTFLRRGIVFCHRDFDWILNKYENEEKFFLYTGRGPSGHTHLGHMIPWLFTKWLQDKFDVELYFQITEDEKCLVKDLTLEETKSLAYENILDVIAVGFDPRKTHIFLDTEYIKTLYPLAVKISKYINFSTARAIFGFENTSNIGIIFFPSIQIAPCFFPSVLKGRNIPCLIPASIDQDDYWRPARDVAPKLGFYKPAQIHNKILPSLQGPKSKMSSSDPNSAVFTIDSSKVVREKIIKYAYSGGQATIEEHRKKGGNPDIDVPYQWLTFFEEDDKKLKQIHDDYKNGDLLTGELKEILIKKLDEFLKEHQKKREKAKSQIEKFMLKD